MAGKSRVGTCSECGVPRRISKENLWLDNGRIVECVFEIIDWRSNRRSK